MKVKSLKKYVITILGFLLSFYFDSGAQKLLNINLESEFEKQHSALRISDFIEYINYVPLETNTNFLVDDNPVIYSTDKELVVKTKSSCLLFNRETGRFILQIGKKGRGPGEFYHTNGFFNSAGNSIFMLGTNGSLLKYDLNGNFIKKISIPEYDGGFVSPSIPGNYTWVNDEIVYYFANINGTEKKMLLISNEQGEKIKEYPNKNIFPKSESFAISSNEAQFYHYKEELFFKEDYSDTVYQVTGNNLISKMVINTGKYLMPYKYKWEREKHKGYLFLRNLIESDSFFFFEFYNDLDFEKKYFSVFNKRTAQLNAANFENIINDIDGFLPIVPKTISTDGQLIGFMEAYKVKLWFDENPDKAKKISPELQKLRNIKETDNPVVIIAKLKE